VLSELMREKPDVSVVHSMDRQPQSSIWITSITLMEIGYGLQSLPAGRRSARLMRELVRIVRHCCGQQAASLLAARRQLGRPIEFRDTMIAGIVMSRHAILATRNTAHFPDLGPTS
jgi:predicted nucleic acid-binding protein